LELKSLLWPLESEIRNSFNQQTLIDLNIDQIFKDIVGKQEDIMEYFSTFPTSLSTIQYRQMIFKDIDEKQCVNLFKDFSNVFSRFYRQYQQMVTQFRNNPDDFLGVYAIDLVTIIIQYQQAIIKLNQQFANVEFESAGLNQLKSYLSNYVQEESFSQLQSESEICLQNLQEIQYCVYISGATVKVRKFDQETDLQKRSIDLLGRLFGLHSQVNSIDYKEEVFNENIENNILRLVFKIYPYQAQIVYDFFYKNIHYLNDELIKISQEIRFYTVYWDYMNRIKEKGLSFCIPQMTESNREILCTQSYDLALAFGWRQELRPIVTNDVQSHPDENVLLITGANQGGKTTFARMFGQIHFLAKLGLPIAGQMAQLYKFDQIFTLFEKAEDSLSGDGKLKEELERLKVITDQATANSLIILNEILSSTAYEDALYIGQKILDEMIRKGNLCLFVTFIDQLSTHHSAVVSLVAEIKADQSITKTLKIIRAPADGLAYAHLLASKYGLTYDIIKERLNS